MVLDPGPLLTTRSLPFSSAQIANKNEDLQLQVKLQLLISKFNLGNARKEPLENVFLRFS